MDDDQRLEEEGERPRPRVVDKRVSARPAAATPPAPATPSTPPQAERGGLGRTAEQMPAAPQPAEPIDPGPTAAPPQDQGPLPSEEPSGQVWTPQQEEQARRIAEELARTPGPDLVVTFAMNFVEVASVKLEAGDMTGAQLAIDSFNGILTAVGSRLGEAEGPMRSVLAQLQMAYAQQAAVPPSPA